MKNVLFIHRSVGHNLIEDGGMYELVSKASPMFSFTDYDHNLGVLTVASGKKQTLNYVFPGGDTKPFDYAQLFSHDVPSEYAPIRDEFLHYDVIVIKSCYPNSNLRSDNELESVKASYASITDFFAQLPSKQLVIMTSPPLVPIRTTKSAATRARALSNWLTHTTFATNISVFNFFDLLATEENKPGANRLKREYRRWLPVDSHPNKRASQEIAPLFVDFIASKL